MKQTHEIVKSEEKYWENKEEFEWLSHNGIMSVLSKVPLPKGNILELCSGSGMFTRRQNLKNATTYTYLDISSTLLKKLKEDLPNIKTVKGDAHNPDYPDNTFDMCYIYAGLHHLPRRDLSIKNSYRLLRDNGLFICFEPNASCFYRSIMLTFRNRLGLYTDDEIFLKPKEIIADLNNAGFKKIKVKYLTPSYDPKHIGRLYLLFLIMKFISLIPGKYFQSFFIITAEKQDK